MTERIKSRLEGKRLLIVEDEYLIASEVAASLEDAGAEVTGIAATVAEALELVRRIGADLDGAVLDVNLRDMRVYTVADALLALGVPFVLATGYDTEMIPAIYQRTPRCAKPVSIDQLEALLSSHWRA
jgi:CheY-like chemotaxis protein